MHVDGAISDADTASDIKDAGRATAIGETLGRNRQNALAGVVLPALPHRRFRLAHGGIPWAE
jgi:hypothetical protein